MRKRRNTRYDSRLNSIIEEGSSKSNEKWVQDGINTSVNGKKVETRKEIVDTINDEDRDDFIKHKNYSHVMSRNDTISSESRGNAL